MSEKDFRVKSSPGGDGGSCAGRRLPTQTLAACQKGWQPIEKVGVAGARRESG